MIICGCPIRISRDGEEEVQKKKDQTHLGWVDLLYSNRIITLLSDSFHHYNVETGSWGGQPSSDECNEAAWQWAVYC
jgi:hypothetical protein